MAGRKRAPSTPKRTPKRSKHGRFQAQAQVQEDSTVLPGGALQTTFQVDGKCSLAKQVFLGIPSCSWKASIIT
jgi:hypothetical protein